MGQAGEWGSFQLFQAQDGARTDKRQADGRSNAQVRVSTLSTVRESASALGLLKLREARARSRLNRLTRREREVLAAVADGMSNRRIGEHLAISPRTVEIHRANMLNKIGASHTNEAIRIAIEAALV